LCISVVCTVVVRNIVAVQECLDHACVCDKHQ
jgi:hypothetical protein